MHVRQQAQLGTCTAGDLANADAQHRRTVLHRVVLDAMTGRLTVARDQTGHDGYASALCQYSTRQLQQPCARHQVHTAGMCTPPPTPIETSSHLLLPGKWCTMPRHPHTPPYRARPQGRMSQHPCNTRLRAIPNPKTAGLPGLRAPHTPACAIQQQAVRKPGPNGSQQHAGL